jgi:mannitol-1-/sugar-/sorbitol-6-phosphatase
MMPLVCDAIVFDLDGVLADSNAVVERHLRLWADRHAIAFERVLEVHHGRPTVETIAMLAPHLDARAEAVLLESLVADDTEGVRAFPGAGRLISALPAGRWGIATSGTRRIATVRLAHIGITRPDVFITADDVTRGKPAPDPYLLAARGLRISPERCLVVEDAPAGVEAARAAGAMVIGIASTLPAEALAGADAVLPRLDDLHVELHEGGLRVSWPGGRDLVARVRRAV